MSNSDVHLKETIDLVHTLFLERWNSAPRDSAKYYVIYSILGCGSTFTSIHKELKRIFRLKGQQGRRDLENGRESLIEEGIMAKISSRHETNMEKNEEARTFKGEQYLPINPRLIYEDITQSQRSSYKLSDLYYELLEKLFKKWERNFREHGLLIEKGILSVSCASPWLLFSLLNYLQIWKREERILHVVNYSTNWFRPPLFSLLVSALEKGLKLKVLLDVSIRTKELDLLKGMKGVEIRNLPKEEIITNRLILAGHKYVMDMHKILGTKGKYSKYVTTIYLNMEDIAEQFEASFDVRWKNASFH
ncbi:MAG: hypothetical protein HXS46_11790 [Theionarchaea archaeon]|nr:hypothetical protein [Theionarchaea archaeon]